MTFTKKAELKHENLYLAVSGFLNETADFGNYDFSKIKQLLMDFSQFEFMNSRGIMIWIRWFHDIRRANKDLHITFSNCPKALIEQFNLINSLLPKNTRVISFSVPMICPKCAHSRVITLQEGRDYQMGISDVLLPVTACVNCGSPMSAEVLPQKYFQFLRSH